MKKNLLIILMCLCLSACLTSVQGAEVSDMELSTGDYGKEDIAWGTAGVGTEETYTVPYYDGSTATNTKVYAEQMPFLLLDKSVEDLINGTMKEYYSTGVIADDITAMGSTAMAYVVQRAITVAANATFNANTVVKVLPGGSFAISTSMTLTLPPILDAGRYTIFTGAGTINADAIVHVLFPEWWGVIEGDKTADTTNSVAVNKIFANQASGHTPLFGRGIYWFADELTMTDKLFYVRGLGNSGRGEAGIGSGNTPPATILAACDGTVGCTGAMDDEHFFSFLAVATPTSNYAPGGLYDLALDCSLMACTSDDMRACAAVWNELRSFNVQKIDIYKPYGHAIDAAAGNYDIVDNELYGRSDWDTDVTPATGTTQGHIGIFSGSDGRIVRNWIHYFEHGVSVFGGNSTITHNYIDLNHGAGVITSTYHTTIALNEINANGAAGVWVAAPDTLVRDNSIFDNGRDPATAWTTMQESGIFLTADGDNAQILGNYIGNKDAPTWDYQTYGVYATAGANNLTISNNHLYRGIQHGIYLVGASTTPTITNNKIWDHGAPDDSGRDGINIGTGVVTDYNITDNTLWSTDDDHQIRGIVINASAADGIIDGNISHTHTTSGGNTGHGFYLRGTGIQWGDTNIAHDNDQYNVYVHNDATIIVGSSISGTIATDFGATDDDDYAFPACPANANGCVITDFCLAETTGIAVDAANYREFILSTVGGDAIIILDTESDGDNQAFTQYTPVCFQGAGDTPDYMHATRKILAAGAGVRFSIGHQGTGAATDQPSYRMGILKY